MMNANDYLNQFWRIQPAVVDCKKCGRDYMMMIGLHKGQSLELPKVCTYCGGQLETFDAGDSNGPVH